MDSSTREAPVGTPSTNTKRTCWAALTLVAEVHEVFPETPVEYSNYDGRNTALDVTFDLTGLTSPDDDDLASALQLVETDERVDTVILGGTTHEGQVLVSFKSSLRTQDSREPFGILDALSVLSGKDEFVYDYDEEEGSA
jgi:hypothetical protein